MKKLFAVLLLISVIVLGLPGVYAAANAFDSEYDSGYEDGYDDGYSRGWDKGWDACVEEQENNESLDVYDRAFKDGETKGYEDGYSRGRMASAGEIESLRDSRLKFAIALIISAVANIIFAWVYREVM